jgi:asparagine synthase (glutamine-hydrolysing)
MTALAGIWNLSGRPDARASCERVLAAQRLYGPHGDAIADIGELAIGRAIFEMLPEDVHDRGPIEGGGGRYRLVADVRLDNREELVDALGIGPAIAGSLCDAALVMRAWERWEEASLARLYGDYAFALWDANKRRLVLARDALGSRPLHYHLAPDFFAFASMPKGLHALPRIPYAPDQERVAEFLALLPDAEPRSFFAGIGRLPAGHLASIDHRGLKLTRYWQPSAGSSRWQGDPVEAVRAELDRAVQTRLRGAGPNVATHLSGGLDSAAVTATAARLMASTGGSVTAFTAVPREGYDAPDPPGVCGNEGPLAAATAAGHRNIEHVLIRNSGTPLDGLDRDFYLFDQPLLNACNHQWGSAINDDAKRRGLKVLLTGAMGNMTISYRGWEILPELMARREWRLLHRAWQLATGPGAMSWKGAALTTLGPWAPRWLWKATARLRRSAYSELGQYSALNAAKILELDIPGRATARALDLGYRPRRGAFETRLWVLRRLDNGNFNKGYLGGWGIDFRDPTADRRLVELCLSLPVEAMLDAGGPAALVRRTLADRIPATVLEERRRGLQAIDWHEGMTKAREALRQEVTRLEQVPLAADVLDLAKMRAAIEDWPEDWNSETVVARYRMGLLRGVASGHFLRKATRSNA